MSQRELDVYESVSRAEYGDDDAPPEVPADAPERMPQIIEQTVNRFRMAIRANPRVSSMGVAGTLPAGLVYSASVIARDALIAMPPTEEGMTNPRQKEHDMAEEELKALRTMNPSAFEDDPVAPPSPIAPSSGGDCLLHF